MLSRGFYSLDTRVKKEAASLAENGYRVVVIAWEEIANGPPVALPQNVYLMNAPTPKWAIKDSTRRDASTPSPEVRSTPRTSTSRSVMGFAKRGFRRVPWLRESRRTLNRAIESTIAHLAYVRLGVRANADVVHAQQLRTLPAAVTLKYLLRAKLVYDPRELENHRTGIPHRRRWWAGFQERCLIHAANGVIAGTPSICAYMAERYRIAPPVLLRGVPPANGFTCVRDIRELAKLDMAATVLLYQGVIARNRGLEQLVDVAPLLPSCVVVIMGPDAGLRSELEERISARHLADVVKVLGPVPNELLLDYTASADLGICCIQKASLSYYWSLPNKLFEYMQSGIPIVASDFPDMSAIVRGEDVGECCDPSDPSSIAAAARRILDDPARRALCRANAAQAAPKYSWEREQVRLLELYDRLLKN